MKKPQKNFFFEKLYPSHTFGFEISKTLVPEYNTGFQKLAVYETPVFGTVLVLDDIVQITDLDEHVYHETMAHTALFSHPNPEYVLIIGGGDLGVAREVLKHKTVKSVHVVDIDPEVTKVATKYFPEIALATAQNKKLTILHKDATMIDDLFSKNSFDVICLDTTDETNVASPLFEKGYLKKVHSLLTKNGILIRLAGSFFFQRSEVLRILEQMISIFTKKRTQLVLFSGSPQYGSPSAFILGSKIATSTTSLNERFKKAHIKTKWYTPEIHVASLSVPSFFLK